MTDKWETIGTILFTSFVLWFSNKVYNFFTGKIKEIDSIEDLKKEVLEIKNKLDEIYNKMIK